MLNKTGKIVVAGMLSLMTYNQSSAQTTPEWKMQAIAIQTRWAKAVNPAHVLPEYPRPQMVRQNNWQNLNGLWEYAITEKDAAAPTHFEGKILVPFPIESALSGVKKSLLPSQLLWYKRTFTVSAKNQERTLLHFGAVDWQTTVYVNGQEVAHHTGGYTAFSADITAALKEGNNEVVVKVYDPTDQGVGPHGKQVLNPGNIYYTPSSGIWQTVWMETVPATFVAGVTITPDVDKQQLHLQVKTSGNADGYAVDAVASSNGKTVKRVQSTRMADGMLDVVIPMNNARLWSPDDPFLYDLDIKLVKNGKAIDQVKSYFGMRKIAIQKDAQGVSRIFLNNKYTYNLGTLDQGFWPDGLYTAPTDEALAFDIEASKAMGFNTIRKHIKIEPARWYYHADKIGMLVWQDFVNPNQRLPEGSKPAFENQVKETLEQLHNYPSITTWVIFNEKWGQFDQKRITEWVKQADPSRIVNGHSGELLYVNNELRSPSPDAYVSADMTDVHSYPFPRNAPAEPGKAQVVGEFGGIGVPVEGHLWNDLVAGWGYDGVVTPATMQKQYTQMVDSLKVLEKAGLSASIYTQPFDVESEQNGLMTYDREIIKLPAATIRNIHAALWPSTGNYLAATKNFTAAVAPAIGEDYATRLQEYKAGKKDSAFLRNLTIVANSQKDKETVNSAASDYVRQLRNPFAETNLRFIQRFTKSSKGAGFPILFNNMEKVNSIIGKNQAEGAIRSVIGKEEIEPYLADKNVAPDWAKINATVKAKYGAIGEEKAHGAQMAYYADKQDWVNFGKYYALYYQTATTRSEYHINNISWSVFEHVTDPEVLAVAVKAAQYSMETFAKNDPNDIDTYANLLYKVGRKQEAIEAEQRAVHLSNNEKTFVETLDKMQKGLPTWN